ncbi:probable ubiquitin carboxyl-terminal hydrolase MINDY-4 isoform X1 [Cebus imitator]|uniref:Ubiquitin carboxyl-terminal hydrolase MINDY n=2 Tax=Cebus imitator TaxID=2715852 RepID=A0A2K5QEG1_CEBIM|nr:probable ubiquitin carboxyl-terminal hydrolase MINDY-4 isoform X1 [Cebus imitator]
MDSLYVEEVAASLVREFLSRKGLKKTCVTMDQERPRSDLSINNRNDLRKVLHLEFLYKENKAKENPLKTSLELITRYFLDHFGNTANNFTQETPIPALSVPKKNNKVPSRCSETTLVNIYDLSDEDAGWRTSLSETSKARHDNLDGDVLGNFISSKRPPHKSKPRQTVPGETPTLASAWEKMDKLHSLEPSLDVKRIGENSRPKSGLTVRGMVTGPIASSLQDSFHKRSLRQSPSSSSSTQPQEESCKVPELFVRTEQDILASSNSSPSRPSLNQLSELTVEKQKTTASSPPHLPSKGLPLRDRARRRDLSEDSPAVEDSTDADRTSSKFCLLGGNSRMTQERLERAFRRQGSQPTSFRKNQLLTSDKVDDELGALQLEDVEDELIREEVILSQVPSVFKLQTASKPIDLSVAKEIKTLLFGSTFCCFNEEWKLQSFSFSNVASLKYGIVQNKGGPCGVLAAVQGCVLQKLLFEGDSKADCARGLQPSDAHRTRCLTLALADIVWRAGGRERAVVALASRTQQFSPAGKYKADGVLETLTLHSLACYEDLVTFLQQSIHQFEVGPYGCILLTLSAILSRSTELIRQDFDVPTSHLIGAHGYCTQELVNLLLTGKAVSNVFNDVVELDSGDGNITLLRGIAARSDIGFLSLFEHYNVCQVGCFLKTPRFPIWVVCSESHFSVLFSLQPGLLRDWRTERLFDLYYYDGLANQQEQIRLTIDTTQTISEDTDNDLVPPLELCIRTKWKGASVNWNGSDPIL